MDKDYQTIKRAIDEAKSLAARRLAELQLKAQAPDFPIKAYTAALADVQDLIVQANVLAGLLPSEETE